MKKRLDTTATTTRTTTGARIPTTITVPETAGQRAHGVPPNSLAGNLAHRHGATSDPVRTPRGGPDGAPLHGGEGNLPGRTPPWAPGPVDPWSPDRLSASGASLASFSLEGVANDGGNGIGDGIGNGNSGNGNSGNGNGEGMEPHRGHGQEPPRTETTAAAAGNTGALPGRVGSQNLVPSGSVALPLRPEPIPPQRHGLAARDEVIELLDDDDDDDGENAGNGHAVAAGTERTTGFKRPRPNGHGGHGPPHHHHYSSGNGAGPHHPYAAFQRGLPERPRVSEPLFVVPPPRHSPTWEFPLPSLPVQPTQPHSQHKHFELFLLNVSEFTITGLPLSLDGRPSSVLGFRKIIKEVSRGHGKCVFERDHRADRPPSGGGRSPPSEGEQGALGDPQNNPDGGKWRIPLGAYRAFYSYLRNDGMCRVVGIPEDQLKIASLGKARLDKGYPSAQKVISYGVPRGLATALAPFQRGGVEFVVEKEGRALIADDMGLGKTIQSIASMSVYHDEWPLLILTPSTARYHWAAEFMNWLGSESSVNQGRAAGAGNGGTADPDNDKAEGEDCAITHPPRAPMRLLKESEIHVLVAGKEKVFPTSDVRIVICSYGLATSLIESKKIFPGLFKCAIVDESHMLKNIKTKRTKMLIPILHATNRCVLLSGTPALARPTELWPQLKILSTERDGWWDDEDDFVRKYVQTTSAIRRAELHTMLTGTVMIRRLKHEILKSLPNKQRERAIVDVLTPPMREDFRRYMELLRQGKGVMAKIAKKRNKQNPNTNHPDPNPSNQIEAKREKIALLNIEYNEIYRKKLQDIEAVVRTVRMTDEEKQHLMGKYETKVKNEVDAWYTERANEIRDAQPAEAENKNLDRKSILNKMYAMTAEAKTPLIAEMVGKWLDDPTKGKLCVFAHHIKVLDEIINRVGLSNKSGSKKRFIRIDGSTSPKERQSQIVAFQNDPEVRIAVLGITAAGVAVTLTASSTVWFAELFWTPALMIQAEDRCHRIGQNATVRCLYFVASGTLDVLLWDLLEKKFQDLGEFVEGREKMKIVVKKTYGSIEEFRSIFDRASDDDLDDVKLGENENPTNSEDLSKLENDLRNDIVQLAEEEMRLVSHGEDEEGTDTKIGGNALQKKSAPAAKSGLGQTEDEAICLSDDEDENPPQNQDASAAVPSEQAQSNENGFQYSRIRPLKKCRIYKQYFEGSSFGIQLLYVDHRLTIARNNVGKIKPSVGDVLVAVNGNRLPFGCRLDQVCRYMKAQLNHGAVELTFIEDEPFVKYRMSEIIKARDLICNPKEFHNKKPEDDVIELVDDD